MTGCPAHDGAAVGYGVALGENADELHGNLSAVEVYALHQLHELVPVVGLIHIPCGVLPIISDILADLETGNRNHAHTGSSPRFKEGNGILGGVQFSVGQGVHGGGSGNNAVFQQHVADANGGQCLWNFIHGEFLLTGWG